MTKSIPLLSANLTILL